MVRLLPALSFSLLLLNLLSCLASAQNPDFSLKSGGLGSSNNLLRNPQVTALSSGDLTLDGSGAFAEVIYKDSFSLVDPTPLSFNTYFTVSANSTYANGTFAFVIVPSSTYADNYDTATYAFAVVFNNTCFGFNFSDGSGQWGGGGRFGGGYGGGGYGGGNRFTGPSNTNIDVYAGGQLLPSTYLSTQFPWANGPGWNDPDQNWQSWPNSSCSQQPIDYPLYEYVVALQYNASAKQVTLALGSACFLAGQVVYSQDLSKVITKSAYVGFIASGGAVYNLSQWNFTSNATSSILSVIAASTAVPSSNTPMGSSSSKTHKGYVVGFSLLGGAIGVATLVGACFLFRRRKTTKTTRVQAMNFQSTPTKGVINQKVKTVNEVDTFPLYPTQTRTSSTDTASWLKPVLPR